AMLWAAYVRPSSTYRLPYSVEPATPAVTVSADCSAPPHPTMRLSWTPGTQLSRYLGTRGLQPPKRRLTRGLFVLRTGKHLSMRRSEYRSPLISSNMNAFSVSVLIKCIVWDVEWI